MKLSAEDIAFAASYDADRYWRPSMTADVAVFRMLDTPENATKKYPQRHLEVLLVQRGRPPYKGGWALPGGFCNADETLHACAERECIEETGIAPVFCGEVGTFSQVDRDPRTRVISQCFLGVVPYGAESDATGRDDAALAEWFRVTMKTETISPVHYRVHLTLSGAPCEISGSIDLQRDEKGTWQRRIHQDAEQLAFDHLQIIAMAVECLRTKMYRTDIAFHWVPDVFRIADLQGVFEATLGNELLRTTFFEHVKPLIRRACEQAGAAVGILDQIYEYNKDYCLQDGLSALDLWQA